MRYSLLWYDGQFHIGHCFCLSEPSFPQVPSGTPIIVIGEPNKDGQYTWLQFTGTVSETSSPLALLPFNTEFAPWSSIDNGNVDKTTTFVQLPRPAESGLALRREGVLPLLALAAYNPTSVSMRDYQSPHDCWPLPSGNT